MPERVLNACPACARQYDVSHLAAGAPIRCDCGERFAAKRPRPVAAQAVHCSACGGGVPSGAIHCPYCQAEISPEDRGLGLRCPHCLTKNRSGAAFCASCGGKFEASARPAVREDRSCPRCEGILRGENLDGLPVIECTACGGIWLTPGAFDSSITRSKRLDGPGSRANAETPPYHEDKVRYLPCVGCDELMTRMRIGDKDGATVDVCRHHGLWFDAGELERILAWVRDGGEAHTPWKPRMDVRDKSSAIRPGAFLDGARTSNEDYWWSTPHRSGGLFSLLGDLFLRWP